MEINTPDNWPLKRGEVKHVGDPVAVVVGRERYSVVDAAEQVVVEYDPKPVVTDPERALEDGSPLVWEQFGSNRVHEWKISGGGALFYDPIKEILSGAIELNIAQKVDVKGIGLYQRATSSAGKSWLALVTVEELPLCVKFTVPPPVRLVMVEETWTVAVPFTVARTKCATTNVRRPPGSPKRRSAAINRRSANFTP